MPNTSDSHARQKRTYTSRACEDCKRRRQKCDGGRPQCSRCVARGDVCKYPIADNRKPASKTYVDLLRHRIGLLEQLLRSHSIDIEAGLTSLEANPTVEEHDYGGDDDGGDEELSEAFEGLLSIQESADGRLRYYGPTSWGVEFQSEQQDRNELPSYAAGLRLPLVQQSDTHGHVSYPFPVSLELKAELLDLFFKFHNSWCWIIDERLYRESALVGGQYWSPLLEASILAMGSRFTDDPQVRLDANDTSTAGVLFLEHAEMLLSYDLKRMRQLNITTIQALVCLQAIQIAVGEDAMAYLSSGMAAQIALDAGMHIDPGVFANSLRNTRLDERDMELRRQIYWALYCDDKLFAAYAGRPCLRLDAQASLRTPAVPLNADDTITTVNTRTLALLHVAYTGLARILECILTSLYHPKPSCRGQQRRAYFDSKILQIKTWTYDLDPDLRLEKASVDRFPPSVFTLHMVCHTITILLAKPFLSLPETSSKAKEISMNAAKQTCVIIRQYRRCFGSFRRSPITAVHCTLSAALVMLSSGKRDGDGSETYKNLTPNDDVILCLETLHELSTAWQIAGRIRANLLKLVHSTKAESINAHARMENAQAASTGVQLGVASAAAHPQPDTQYGPLPTSVVGDDGWFHTNTMGLETTLESMIDHFVPEFTDFNAMWDPNVWQQH